MGGGASKELPQIRTYRNGELAEVHEGAAAKVLRLTKPAAAASVSAAPAAAAAASTGGSTTVAVGSFSTTTPSLSAGPSLRCATRSDGSCIPAPRKSPNSDTDHFASSDLTVTF